MNDLIKALLIFSQYMDADTYSPTHCEHDELYVMVEPEKVSPEHIKELEELGFHPSEHPESFSSFRFGSA